MADSPISFAGHFARADEQTWIRAVEKALGDGADFDRLSTLSADEIAIRPIYPRAADREPIASRPANRPWRIITSVDHPDLGAGNRQALADLDGGADGLALTPQGAPSAFGFGVPLGQREALYRLLDGVALHAIDLRLEPGPGGRRLAETLREVCAAEQLEPETLRISFGLDPVGLFAAHGGLDRPWTDVARAFAQTAGTLADDGFVGTLAEADGRVYHGAGATPAQELAAVLATATCYLRFLAPALGLNRAADAVGFTLTADADQFATIAKIRAARILWAQIRQSCGLDDRPARLHAQTGWRMMTRRDPHVNLLRTTMAAFSAGVGGADSIGVLPFTQAIGLPDEFARRLARNIQHILVEESNVHRVGDPGSGAGYIEAFTDDLAEKAWALFQETERVGGQIEALRSGWWQSLIGAARDRQANDIASRTRRLTGSTAFADLTEMPATVLESAPPHTPPQTTAEDRIEPLVSGRDAEPFERLRDRSDRHLAETGARPSLVLVSLPKTPADVETVNWIANFFAAGGIETTAPMPADDRESVRNAITRGAVKAACILGTGGGDNAAADKALGILREAGARMILIAGAPVAGEAPVNTHVPVQYVYEGCNALDVLTSLYDVIED